jgi:hypothetical protein
MKHYAIGTYKKRGNDYVRDGEGKFSSFKKRAWNFLKPKLAVVGLMYLLGGAYFIGTLNGGTVQAELIKEEGIPPVLQRIMGCESQGSRKAKGSHYDKNGQVLMRSNTNRSVDVGIAQINTVWFKTANDMGLDITNEEDNKAMAKWIYENEGTGPWYSSQNCWK